jgi:hypothetical protein
MWIKMGFSLFFSDARAANFSPRAQLAAECFSTQRRRPNLFHLFELAGSLSRWRLVYGGSISINHPLWANYSNCYVARERAGERGNFFFTQRT